MKYFLNILNSIFWIYSLISFIGISAATILTINGYYYLGRWPVQDRAYSIKWFVDRSANHSDLFLIFIDKMDDCMGLSIILGYLLVFPAMLFGYYKLFQKNRLGHKIRFIPAFILANIFFLILFQGSVGLKDEIYCFLCWYLD